MRIQLSQLIDHLFGGPIKKELVNGEVKSIPINNTNKNMVLSGRDQVSSQELLTHHFFGVLKEFPQKLPNKVLLEIAGSSLLLLQLLVSQRESTAFSKTPSILMMVLLVLISTSEEKESVLPLMIESQFSILVPITLPHIHQLTPSHPHKELGG